jgi:hypothetical protein
MRGKGDDGSATWAGQVGGASGDAAVASVVNRDGGNGAKTIEGGGQNTLAQGESDGTPTTFYYGNQYIQALGGIKGNHANGNYWGNGGINPSNGVVTTMSSISNIDYFMSGSNGNGGQGGGWNGYNTPGGNAGNVTFSADYPIINGYGSGRNGGRSGNGNDLLPESLTEKAENGICRVYYIY